MRLLIVLLLCTCVLVASAAEPPSKPFDWPIDAIADVTETETNAGGTRVLTYFTRLMPAQEKGRFVLGFVGLESLTVNGQAVAKEKLPGGPLWQPELLLDKDGAVVGVHRNAEVVALYKDLVQQSREAKDIDPAVATRMLSDAMVQRFLDNASTRYCNWMCAWQIAPMQAGVHDARDVATPILGFDVPSHADVWWESPAGPNAPAVVHAVSRIERKDLGDDVVRAMQQHAGQLGVQLPPDTGEAFVLETRFRSEHDARHMRPEKVLVENVLLGADGKVRSTSSTLYELRWGLSETELAELKRDAPPASKTMPTWNPEPTDAHGNRVASVARRKPPRYPPSAIRRREEGEAIATVLLDATCKPTDVTLKKSSGSEALDQAALDSLRQSEYHCALEANAPVATELDVPTSFRMR